MALKNTVAAERRLDLASLFCMIGRHGPAVALVVIAMVSMLAAFIIYRTVRGKRRQAAAGDGERSSGGEERDAAVIHPSTEEHHRFRESTDMSDGGLSGVMKDVDVTETDLKIRRRPAAVAAEKKPPPHSPLNIPAPKSKTTTSDSTKEATVVWDAHKPAETLEEETSPGPLSDTSTVAGPVLEDVVDFQLRITDDAPHNEMEVVQDNNGCLMEPELVHDENHEEEKEVYKVQSHEGEEVTADEEDIHCSLNKQTSPINQKDDSNKTAHTDFEEPAIHVEDVPATCICSDEDERLDEEYPDSINYSNDSGNIQLPPEEEKKDDDEKEKEEDVDYQGAAEQAEVCSTNWPLETVMSPIQDGDQEEDKGLAAEVTEEVADEEDLNKLTAVRFETNLPQCDKHKDLRCDEEDGGDHVKEKIMTGDDVVISQDNLGVSESIKLDNLDLVSMITDAQLEVSGRAEFPDSSLTCPPQMEDKMASSQDEDGPEIPSTKEENLPEINRNISSSTAEELKDHNVQSCYKDQRKVHVMDSEVPEKASVAADPDTIENIDEEISCPGVVLENNEIRVHSSTEEISPPDMLPPSQDQEVHQVKKDFSDVGVALVPTDDVPPTRQIHLPSSEQSEQRYDDVSSLGVDQESGISSLAVSPDVQDAGHEFGNMSVGDVLLPVMYADSQTTTQNNFFADDVALSVIKEDIEDTAIQILDQFSAANEDMFGHEIEESYHREMDQFAARIAVSLTSYTDDMKTQTDLQAMIEIVEIKEKTGGRSDMKEDAKEEKEEEEGCERSEISIMEATMDNNEWITESNYQVLPWLNLSGQEPLKTNQLPVNECCTGTEATCSHIPSSTEVKDTSSLPATDENTENNKKVVAVQPMPQNVSVTFRVHYFTQSPYQTVALTGNQQELGNWKEFIPLDRAKDGHWATVVSLPAESHVEWKFVVLEKGEVCRWEECGNRLLDTGFGDDLLVHKWWGLM